jgi:hypothetical protein
MKVSCNAVRSTQISKIDYNLAQTNRLIINN